MPNCTFPCNSFCNLSAYLFFFSFLSETGTECNLNSIQGFFKDFFLFLKTNLSYITCTFPGINKGTNDVSSPQMLGPSP